MIRVLELLALLAPLAAAALLIRYRDRSRQAFVWGIAGCVLGVAASALGLVSSRASVVGALVADEGTSGILERIDTWALVRFVLLLVACALLVIAAVVDRGDRRAPGGWLLAGLVLVAGSIALHGADPALRFDHERLGRILVFVLEAVEVGLLGGGVLVLAVAAVARRPAADDLPEPTDLARRMGTAAWRFYADRGTGTYR